jgi:hypothetical protein
MGGTIHSAGTLMMGGVVGSPVVNGGSAGFLVATATLQPQAGAIEMPHDLQFTAQRPTALGGHAPVPAIPLDPLTGAALAGLLGGVVVWQRVHRVGGDTGRARLRPESASTSLDAG